MDALLGAALGRYQIDRLLGEGGMGRVYGGVDPQTGQPVAIKIIADEHARDEELVRRFYAEAHAATRIRHPGIVEVFDLTYLPDGRPAIVMELLRGRTLRAVIQAGPVGLDVVVAVMTQVLDAVAAAHAAGIVHRDLKPDNIIIDDDGRAKVLDFGIAKLGVMESARAAPRTRTGMMLGTPDYMAPEQITGGAIDGRTDVYAAGAMLFETLTGHRPFEGDSQFFVLQGHMTTPPPSPRMYRAEVSAAFEAVVLRAMAKSPGERYPSASAMASALTAALTESGQTSTTAVQVAAPASLTAATAPPVRSRAVIWGTAAITIFLAIGVAAAVIATRRPARPAATAPLRAPAPPVTAPPVYVNPYNGSRSDDFMRAPAPRDPGNFDPSAFTADALGLAQKLMPGVELVYLEVDGVRADGMVDLTMKTGHVTWIFWSRAMGAARPAKLAKNAEYRAQCIVRVEASASETQVLRTSDLCDQQEVHVPRCSFAQLWARAVKRGADPSYVAQIMFVRGTWRLMINNVPDRGSIDYVLKNDCNQ